MNSSIIKPEPDQSAYSGNIPDNVIAALDIGSNSIHFVFGEITDGRLKILHAEKYSVSLAAGLNNFNQLSQDAMDRALAVLQILAPTVAKLTTANFRVVATYTLRQAKNAAEFLRQAQQVFPFPIEIISGHEEARLIYQGVARLDQSAGKRLVIDIGGGSTEFVIGEQFTPFVLASTPMGCISFTQRFFSDGKLNKANFNKAITAAKLNIESILTRFNKVGWQTAIGTSGSIKALYNWYGAEQGHESPLTLSALNQLKQALIAQKRIDAVNIEAIKPNRLPIIAAGLAILIAAFELLDLQQMIYCDYSLREGVLFEKADLIGHSDIRLQTVQSLAKRFNADGVHSQDVAQLARQFFQSADFRDANLALLLDWAAMLHEIGMDINPSSFHQHGQYIIANADLAGFNRSQQQALAWLVGNQRKKIMALQTDATIMLVSHSDLYRLLAILRLAILLNQQRNLTDLPDIVIKIVAMEFHLSLPKDWPLKRPLILADLEQERKRLQKVGIDLTVKFKLN